MQLRRYIAQIRLLDAGLLEEAHHIANFLPVSQDTRDEGDGTERETQGGQVAPQNAAEHIIKVDKYVKGALAMAKKQAIGKDEYKDGLVFEERRALLDGVFKQTGRPWARKCSRCHA